MDISNRFLGWPINALEVGWPLYILIAMSSGLLIWWFVCGWGGEGGEGGRGGEGGEGGGDGCDGGGEGGGD